MFWWAAMRATGWTAKVVFNSGVPRRFVISCRLMFFFLFTHPYIYLHSCATDTLRFCHFYCCCLQFHFWHIFILVNSLSRCRKVDVDLCVAPIWPWRIACLQKSADVADLLADPSTMMASRLMLPGGRPSVMSSANMVLWVGVSEVNWAMLLNTQSLWIGLWSEVDLFDWKHRSFKCDPTVPSHVRQPFTDISCGSFEEFWYW